MSPKTKKIINIIIITCIVIIVGELIFFGYEYFKKKNNKTYYDSINAFSIINKGYIGVGSNNDNSLSLEKGKITKYDSKKNKVWEKFYNKGYNSTFFNVKEDKGDFVVVGSYEKTKKEKKDKTRTALFVKYDKDGTVIFEKNLQILGNSKFVNLQVVDDGYIVVGQSIFENMTLGLSEAGGGVIVKYDKSGKEVWRSNYGGGKSGLYNDLTILDGYIYVAGKDAARVGTITKYSLTGERIKTTTYEYTDTLGFTSITSVGNKLIVAGAKKIKEEQEDYDTDAILVKYDEDCDLIDSVIYRKNGMERFNKVITDSNNNLVVVGHTAVIAKNKSTKSLNVFSYNGLIAKYKKNLTKVYCEEYGDTQDDYFTDIEEENNRYLVSGYSSYKKDGYLSKFITYSKQGENLEVK